MSTSSTKSSPIIIAQIMGKWLGGGVESVVMNYYREIDKTKFQFDFICDADSTNIPYQEIKRLGGRVFLIPPYQKIFAYLKALKQLFSQQKYTIVHSHINTLSLFPLSAAKSAGIKVRIAHSHSTSNPKEWQKNLLKNCLRPFSKIFATHYFACGELAGSYLFGKKTFNQGKVTVIHNAINLADFTYQPHLRKSKRQILKISPQTTVIGHIGRFEKQKNHSFLIDVFAAYHRQNPNSVLLLAGQGPLKDLILNKVHALQLENHVKFLGQVTDINQYYSVFDLFILPSLYEGLPVVGIEAQAAGLPCLLADNITREVILPTMHPVFQKDFNPTEWANTITKLLNAKTPRKSPPTTHQFNSKQSIKQLTSLYLSFS